MANKKFKCLRCEEEFIPGNWLCKDGAPHKVDAKSYYIPGVGLSIHYGPVKGDNPINNSRKVLTFVNGTYFTADPEQQELLDKYPGTITQDEWKAIHLSPAEREMLAKENTARLERDNNSLLAKIKELQEGNAQVTVPPDDAPHKPKVVGRAS